MESNEQPFSSSEDGGSDSDSDLGTPSIYVLQPKKRTNEENQSSAVNSSSNKKPKSAGCIAKIWSDEDEVTLLNGVISYQDSTGLRFNADLKAFYKFVEGDLQARFSKEQIAAKIRRLKKRFFNVSITRESSNFHDVHMFSISEKIWGDPATVGNGNLQIGVNKKGKDNDKSVHKGKNVEKRAEEVELDEKLEEELEDEKEEEEELEEEKEKEEEEEKEKEEELEQVDIRSKYPFLSSSFGNLMSSYPSLTLSEGGMDLVLGRLRSNGDSKLKEFDDKWKHLAIEEGDFRLKKLTLMMEQVKKTL